MTDTTKQPNFFIRFFRFLKTGPGLLILILWVPSLVLVTHEMSAGVFQDKTCVICHEMKEPIRKWEESGTAKNHWNCAGCHFDSTMEGRIHFHKTAVRLLVEHFKRDPDEPIKPKEEPLFLDDDKEPGYWSHVPNHRCFQCKQAPNHREKDQPRIHKKLVEGISDKPCKDCHNHEMRKGQKFYEKVLPGQEHRASVDSTLGQGQ